MFLGKKPGETPATNAASRQNEIAVRWGPTLDFPFRSMVVPSERKSGVPRIWFASASHAEDVRVRADKLFPNLVGTQMSEANHPVEIINASRAGMSISANIDELKEGFEKWQPDVGVLYQLVNDLTTLSRKASQNDNREEVAIQAKSATGVKDWLNQALEGTTLFAVIKTNFTARVREQCVLPQELPQNADKEFIKSIELFVLTARRLNVEPVICTVAMSHNEKNFSKIPDDYLLGMLRQNPDIAAIGWANAVQRWNARIRTYCYENQVRLADIALILDGHPEFFRDAVHFNEAGHARIAEYISDRLQSWNDADGGDQ